MTTRRELLRRSGLLLGATAAARILGAAPALAKPGGTLTAAIVADPINLDHHLAQNPEGRGTSRAIHGRLFRVDRQGQLAPDLAESWEQPDERTYLVHVRPGMKFHDGTPIDAEAVRVNLERVRDPRTKSLRAGEVGTIDTVETLSAKTLRIRLKVPFAAFLFPLSDMAGCIASPAALQRWGADYGMHPVGAGPFRFVEYRKDAQTVIEKNPGYWQAGKPLLDQVVLRPIPVDGSRLAELRSGGVQLCEGLPLQDVRRLRQMPEIVVSEKVGFRWQHFAFNHRPQFPGSNQKFRQAFQWAIDREALRQVVYFGTGSVAYDGILPGSPFFDPEYRPFTHDVDRARRLMDESGLKRPVVMKAGLRQDPVMLRAAQVLQAAAEKLEVKVEIEPLDAAASLARIQQGTDPINVQGWWGYRPDPDQYLYTLLHSTGTWAQYFGYGNPKMDRLLEAERAARTTAERRRTFRTISELMNEDAPYVSWHFGSDFKGLSPNVEGFVHYQDSIVLYEDISLRS
jgi:peptide/nickel transport system substrate-binding protein